MFFARDFPSPFNMYMYTNMCLSNWFGFETCTGDTCNWLLLLLLLAFLLKHMWFIHGYCFGEQVAFPSMTFCTCGSFCSNLL